MKRIVSACLVLGLGVWGISVANAANLLINPNLDVPGVHESDAAPPWVLDEYRINTGPTDTATMASFANHNAGGTNGMWGKAFSGNHADPANADLYQDVPGTPGMKYILTGWSLFESAFAGGVNNVIITVDDEFVFVPSPTDTFFALDFLGAGDSLISTSQIELKADGQKNGQGWKQHMLMAIAPDGTVEVRARASMFQGVNSGVSGGQSVFFDEFTLDCVPEPASAAIGLLAMVGLGGFIRRR